MERDNLAQSSIATYRWNLISKARVVVLVQSLIKRVASILLMLVFTISAFVVLVASVVLLTAESVVSAIWPQAKASQKRSLQDLLKGKRFSSPSQFSQTE